MFVQVFCVCVRLFVRLNLNEHEQAQFLLIWLDYRPTNKNEQDYMLVWLDEGTQTHVSFVYLCS